MIEIVCVCGSLLVLGTMICSYYVGRWTKEQEYAETVRALEKHAQALADDLAHSDREARVFARTVIMFERDLRAEIDRKTMH